MRFHLRRAAKMLRLTSIEDTPTEQEEIAAAIQRQAIVSSKSHQEACVLFKQLFDKEILDEPGSEEMIRDMTGYEEHGMFVEKEAVRNQFGIEKIWQPAVTFDNIDRMKLASLVYYEEHPVGRFMDLIGAEAVKEVLEQQWALPQKFPNFFVGNRRPWDSLLLYGLPGTGKSRISYLLAAEIKGRFIRVLGHKLRFDIPGKSEQTIRDIFALAKEQAPTVLLFDDVEELFEDFPSTCTAERALTRRITAEFFDQISELNTLPKAVIVLAATNKPHRVEKTARNCFEKMVYMNLPTQGDRAYIFNRYLGNAEHVLKQGDFEELARRTVGYTGGDIIKVIRNARLKPLNEAASAFNFKKLDAPSKLEDGGLRCFWTACDAKDSSGMEMTWREVPDPEDLVIPKLTFNRMLQAVLRVKPSTYEISDDKIMAFRTELMNEYIIHNVEEDHEDVYNQLRENRKWYDCFLECFVG